jgi:hypothetical protein
MSSSTCRVSGGLIPGGSGDLQRPNATPISGRVLGGGPPSLVPGDFSFLCPSLPTTWDRVAGVRATEGLSDEMALLREEQLRAGECWCGNTEFMEYGSGDRGGQTRVCFTPSSVYYYAGAWWPARPGEAVGERGSLWEGVGAVRWLPKGALEAVYRW